MIKHWVWVSTSRKGLTFWETGLKAFLARYHIGPAVVSLAEHKEWQLWENRRPTGLHKCKETHPTQLVNLEKGFCVSSFKLANCQGLIPKADMSSILWPNTVPVRALLSVLNYHFHTDIHCTSSHWKKTLSVVLGEVLLFNHRRTTH